MSALASLPSFGLRIEVPEDRHFILSSWRSSEKDAALSRGPNEGNFEGTRFGTIQSAMMNAVLSRRSTCVTVVHPRQDPGTILGWIAARPPRNLMCKGPRPCLEVGPAPIIYYLFVRKEIRCSGIARMLLGELPLRKDVIYTAKPARVHSIHGWQPSPLPIPRGWRYLPRAAFVEAP